MDCLCAHSIEDVPALCPVHAHHVGVERLRFACRSRDAEIAALKAEVERLTGLLDDADQVTRDALGHARCAWEGDRRRLERALAAGPALLRKVEVNLYPVQAAEVVERAQAEAMKEEP